MHALPDNTAPASQALGQAACDALIGGCDFLIARGALAPNLTTSTPPVALRRAGNCLNELDRLLSILLDASAGRHAMPPSERVAFQRSRDTPRKLRKLDRLNGTTVNGTRRLQAIARLRRTACGNMRRAPRTMLARDLVTATGGLVENAGANLVLSDKALAHIAHFYRAIAERLALQYGYPAAQREPIR